MNKELEKILQQVPRNKPKPLDIPIVIEDEIVSDTHLEVEEPIAGDPEVTVEAEDD